MRNVNQLFYNYIYADVKNTKIPPEIHFLNYGEGENRFKNTRSIKLISKQNDLFLYLEIFLLFVYFKLTSINLFQFSELVKKAVVILEYRRIKNLEINVIILNSWLKGGTFEVSNLYASNLSNNQIVLVARTFENMTGLESNPMSFEIWVQGKVTFRFTSFFSVEILNRISPTRKVNINLFINHIFNYESNFKNLELDFFNNSYYIVNDYYLFNSKWNLFDSNAQLNLRQIDVGDSTSFKERLETLDIVELYESIDVFVVPSLDTFRRVHTLLYPKKCVVSYHPEIPNIENTKLRISNQVSSTRNILLVGDLGSYKGEEEIALVLKHFSKNRQYNFHHFGTKIKHFEIYNYLNYGNFERHNLPRLIRDLGIDFAFLPFQCFETYSFALSDIFKLGLPLVTTDIGSIAERCIGRPYTILLDPNSSLNQMLTAFDAVKSCEKGYDNVRFSKKDVEFIIKLRLRKEINDF